MTDLSRLSPRERDLLIRTVIGEAAAEPDVGKQAVAHVIANRMNQSGRGLENVIFAKNQFEPWGTDASRNRLMSLSTDSPQYQRASAALAPMFSGPAEDPTRGATHFYAPAAQAALGRSTPAWARNAQGTDIGRHRFYNLGYGGAGPSDPHGTRMAYAGGQASAPSAQAIAQAAPQGGRIRVASNDPGFVPTPPQRPTMEQWQKTAQSMQGPASANEAMAQILRDDAAKRGYASWSPQTPSPNDAPAQWNPVAAVQRLFGGQAPEQAKAAIAPPAPAPASPEASSMPADVPLPPPRPMASGGPGDGGFHLTPQPRMQGGFNDPQQALAALLMNEAYA